MDAIALLVAVVVAAAAACLSALVDGAWGARALGARFALALVILVLPGFIR